jgi:hypothetical protein
VVVHSKDIEEDKRVKYSAKGKIKSVTFEVVNQYYDHSLPRDNAWVAFPEFDINETLESLILNRINFLLQYSIKAQDEHIESLLKDISKAKQHRDQLSLLLNQKSL